MTSTVELSLSERTIIVSSLRYTARKFVLESRTRKFAGPSRTDMRASYRRGARAYNALADRIESTP